jgi:two-component system OmpR family response regulator
MAIRKIAGVNEPIIALLTSMFKGAPRRLEAPEMGAGIHIPKSTHPLNVVVLVEQLLDQVYDRAARAS